MHKTNGNVAPVEPALEQRKRDDSEINRYYELKSSSNEYKGGMTEKEGELRGQRQGVSV